MTILLNRLSPVLFSYLVFSASLRLRGPIDAVPKQGRGYRLPRGGLPLLRAGGAGAGVPRRAAAKPGWLRQALRYSSSSAASAKLGSAATARRNSSTACGQRPSAAW